MKLKNKCQAETWKLNEYIKCEKKKPDPTRGKFYFYEELEVNYHCLVFLYNFL